MLDTLIHNALVVTVDPAFTILEGGALAVRSGRIENVWAPRPGEPLPEARERVDARGGLLLPGLVNAHTHLPMTLLRGLADDLPLSVWLQEHIFPAEALLVTPANVDLGTRLACAEMLSGGITTCCDGYFLAGQIANSLSRVGMRAVLGQGVIDFPAPGVPDPARNVETASQFVRGWLGRSPLLQPAIFCHSTSTCSTDTLRKAKAAAAEAGVLFQVHAAETRDETEQCRRAHGTSPIGLLDRIGALDRATLLVHAVWLSDDDIGLIARSGAAVAHCPESNMKLGSGIAPVPALLAAGVRVGLGTDGCASNNDLDLFGEMNMAAKLHKVKHLDPTVMDARTVLRMATIGGARALGLDGRIGSLEAGKEADLILLSTDRPHMTPMFNAASHLVYAAGAADVRHVMIAGKWVVKDRVHQTIDLAPLLAQARAFPAWRLAT